MIVNQHLWMVDMVNHSKCQYGFIMVNNGDEWWFDVICGCYYNGHYPLVSSNLAETSPNKMEFFFLLAAEMAIAIIAMDYQSYLLCSTRLGYFAYNIYIYIISSSPQVSQYILIWQYPNMVDQNFYWDISDDEPRWPTYFSAGDWSRRVAAGMRSPGTVI